MLQPSAAPAGLRRRFCYDNLIARLQAAPPDEWVLLSPDELAGTHRGIKQGRLIQAANQRGLKITTVFRSPGDVYYAMLISPRSSSAVAQ
jgi:hypothetical protein